MEMSILERLMLRSYFCGLFTGLGIKIILIGILFIRFEEVVEITYPFIADYPWFMIGVGIITLFLSLLIFKRRWRLAESLKGKGRASR